MNKHGWKLLAVGLMLFIATACAVRTFANPTPTEAKRARRTRTPSPPAAELASATAASSTPSLLSEAASTNTPALALTQAPPATFCADARVTAVINSLKSALLTSDGALLTSLVSPAHGMDARLFRAGRVVNYDREHAQFLFQSTFAVDWGNAPGSGLPSQGSFHELMLPALLEVFKEDYTLTCDQIHVGGTTYQISWPYAGIDYYSAYFPGTQANGNLDWRTWVLGIQYVNGEPFLYAIMQFQWEP
jgi:hypothetical protein